MSDCQLTAFIALRVKYYRRPLLLRGLESDGYVIHADVEEGVNDEAFAHQCRQLLHPS